MVTIYNHHEEGAVGKDVDEERIVDEDRGGNGKNRRKRRFNR